MKKEAEREAQAYLMSDAVNKTINPDKQSRHDRNSSNFIEGGRHMQLWEYLDEQVKITTFDGSVYRGFADIYHFAEDTASGIASLTIALADGSLIDFDEHEIASIDFASITTQNMAVAV